MVFTDYQMALDFLESQIAHGNPDALLGLNINNEPDVIGRANQIGLNIADGDATLDVQNAYNSQEESLQQVQDMGESIAANVKSFNLKKAQVFPQATPINPFGAESTPEGLQLEQDYMASDDPVEQVGGLQWESPEALG